MKISTLSYFLKRLRDSGYVCWKIFDEYSESDSRIWTILIDPSGASIYCTYYANDKHFFGESYYELYDGGQFLPEKMKIKTDSMEIILEFLNKRGIIQKDNPYKSKKTK
jgi:hypothetical protein